MNYQITIKLVTQLRKHRVFNHDEKNKQCSYGACKNVIRYESKNNLLTS